MQVSDNKISHLIDRATAVRAALNEKRSAFDEIVARFQDMAFACAYGALGDFYLAEDAAQEAFVSAWRNLDQLRVAEAFPGWFKRIVLTQCHRITRNKQFELVPLEAVAQFPAHEPEPPEAFDAAERTRHIAYAINSLPEGERMVTALFYLGDCSTSEIAQFLEVPLTTVKKRLFDARKHLRGRMTTMDAKIRDSLKDKRPSRDAQFADTVRLFNDALESFVAKVKQDRYVIAAILFGSLSHDTVWRKSDIDIILVVRDGALGGPRKDVKDCTLVENGVNIHVTLYARSKFKQMIEGQLKSDFMASSFALSTLLYTTDDSLRALYTDVQQVGAHDQQMMLMQAGSGALYTLAKAEKWLLTRRDVNYSFLWVMYTLEHLARIEVTLHGEVIRREVLQQALKLNPKFFNKLYGDLIHGKKDEATIQGALNAINAYIDSKVELLFGPVLDYLKQQGRTVTTSQLGLYFTKQVQTHTLTNVYEWLADKGLIQKVSSPMRLTYKSQVTVDEAAYYCE
jgi:RNA polymerase sigma factor (sigma-70 family)